MHHRPAGARLSVPARAFHVWHSSGDLYLTDLATGQTRPLSEVNSEASESFKAWSSNSRWIVFTSRRDDGSYTRLYFTHFGPEFTVAPVRWDPKRLEDILLSTPVQAKLR